MILFDSGVGLFFFDLVVIILIKLVDILGVDFLYFVIFCLGWFFNNWFIIFLVFFLYLLYGLYFKGSVFRLLILLFL